MSLEKDECTARSRSSISEERLHSQPCKSSPADSRTFRSRPVSPQAGTSFEVFRNDTTAVEVVVKEVPHKRLRKLRSPSDVTGTHKILKLQQQVQDLRIDLNNARTKLKFSKQGFGNLVGELQKQLDLVSKNEIDEHMENISLRLENDKLKAMLESKGRTIEILKKEMSSMKRLLKFLIKTLKGAPAANEALAFMSDLEYDDFERELKRDGRVRFMSNTYEGLGSTLDSSNMSKNAQSFDK